MSIIDTFKGWFNKNKNMTVMKDTSEEYIFLDLSKKTRERIYLIRSLMANGYIGTTSIKLTEDDRFFDINESIKGQFNAKESLNGQTLYIHADDCFMSYSKDNYHYVFYPVAVMSIGEANKKQSEKILTVLNAFETFVKSE